jgi:hypothetical protein
MRRRVQAEVTFAAVAMEKSNRHGEKYIVVGKEMLLNRTYQNI